MPRAVERVAVAVAIVEFPLLLLLFARQMLVYENYSKFITATDTIRAMSASMQGMDGRMHELRGLIGEPLEGLAGRASNRAESVGGGLAGS